MTRSAAIEEYSRLVEDLRSSASNATYGGSAGAAGPSTPYHTPSYQSVIVEYGSIMALTNPDKPESREHQVSRSNTLTPREHVLPVA
jgi:hypothetical protein